jgi:hypothetical protein
MLRLSIDALGSREDAHFAVKELLPLLATGETREAMLAITDNFEKFKKEKENDHID